jgi:hypothetical protein
MSDAQSWRQRVRESYQRWKARQGARLSGAYQSKSFFVGSLVLGLCALVVVTVLMIITRLQQVQRDESGGVMLDAEGKPKLMTFADPYIIGTLVTGLVGFIALAAVVPRAARAQSAGH